MVGRLRKGLLRAVLWGVCLALCAPLAFGVTPPPPKALELPEVVVRGMDRVRLEAQRQGVLPLEAPRLAETAPRVELPTGALPSSALGEAPPVQSPGCAYRNPITGALARAGNAPDALYKTALERLSRDRLDEAAYYLARLRTDHPEHPNADDAAFWLGEINRRKGRTEEALAYFRLVRGAYDGEAAYRTAWLLASEGRAREALAAWAALAKDETNPHRPEALYRLGVGRLEAGDSSGAVGPLRAVQDLEAAGHPVDPEIRAVSLLALGFALRAAGDPAGAEKALLKFLLERPDHPSAPAAQAALGWALLDQGKAREASLRFQWVLDTSPPAELKVRALYGRLRAQADLGEEAAAVSTLNSIEAAGPTGPWIGWARADVGWIAFRQGKYLDSLDRYRSALKVWQGGGDDVPRYMVAESLYLLGRYPDAAQAYQVLTAESPLHAVALHRAGLCALLAGDDAEARRLFEEDLKDHPGYPEADRVWAWLGEARLRLGKRDEALQAFQAVPSDSPAYPQALYGEAWIAFESERWDEAASLFSRFLAASPQNANRDEALLTLARAQFNRRDVRAALDALNRLKAGATSAAYRSAARFYRGWMLARSGQEDRGRGILQALLAEEPSGAYAARAHQALAWLDYGAGRYEDALAHFEAVLRLNPGGDAEQEALQKKADCLYNLARYEEALAAYRSLGDSPEARFGEALSLQRLGRLAEFAEAADKFASSFPKDSRAVDIYFALAEARTKAGDPAGAAAAYQRAAQIAGRGERVAEARLEAARSLARAGDVLTAKAALRSLAGQQGAVGTAALRDLAQLCGAHGAPEEARDAYDHLAAAVTGEERAEALRSAARWARVLLDWAGAGERLDTALKACPPEAAPLRQALLADRGEVFLLEGRPKDAEAPLSEAAEMGKSPDGLRAHLALGQAQEAAGQVQEALETYLRIGYLYPVEDPEVARVLMRAGELFASQGSPDRARAVYDKVASGAPDEWADQARSRLAELGETNRR